MSCVHMVLLLYFDDGHREHVCPEEHSAYLTQDTRSTEQLLPIEGVPCVNAPRMLWGYNELLLSQPFSYSLSIIPTHPILSLHN